MNNLRYRNEEAESHIFCRLIYTEKILYKTLKNHKLGQPAYPKAPCFIPSMTQCNSHRWGTRAIAYNKVGTRQSPRYMTADGICLRRVHLQDKNERASMGCGAKMEQDFVSFKCVSSGYPLCQIDFSVKKHFITAFITKTRKPAGRSPFNNNIRTLPVSRIVQVNSFSSIFEKDLKKPIFTLLLCKYILLSLRTICIQDFIYPGKLNDGTK